MRDWKFRIGEWVYINEEAKKGLPNDIGKVGTVFELLTSGNYDYYIDSDHELIKVKENELIKLHEHFIDLYKSYKNNSQIIYTPTNETVIITSCDFLHNKFEILFDEGCEIVVDSESLKLINKKQQRKSWDEYFMDIAELVATRATCDRLHVGCVIVKDKRIVSTGYNGSPSGESHCDEVGHLYNDQNRCIRTIHAEQNAILFANRLDLKGATAYVTHQPCENCAKLLVQSGIKRIVFKNKYTNTYSDYFTNMVEAVHLGG